MKLRQLAVALLVNEKEELLFLRKRKEDAFFANFYLPIGGHIGEHELNNPEAACYREIFEETGMTRSSIRDLRLAYIIHRLKETEIRIQYVFVGRVHANQILVPSNEGELFWMSTDSSTLTTNISETTYELVKHFKEHLSTNEAIFVGSMHSAQGLPAITWSTLEDWERKQ
ncbi:NUDIX domain-containing protein [Alkalihalobacillus sp. LMS6]|uniref:NUDIX domain-containing protein n=1 Tax=Alkalihalobacillus sp. LMS6 TaxID=2924034 RepID=UPI0020D0C27A|nr:NUDIX domain-containing protein [Alkalihalobacillus sp. LMS6]UTR07070.1 NUDIX domain-containing protein [Alkalihalobacillus sp. LMS6]